MILYVTFNNSNIKNNFHKDLIKIFLRQICFSLPLVYPFVIMDIKGMILQVIPLANQIINCISRYGVCTPY